jgi:hypothetical protein
MEKKKQEIPDDFLGINPAMDHMMSVIRHQSKMTDIIEDKKEKSYPQEPKLIELGSEEEWQYPTTLDEVVKVKRKMSLDLTKAQIALENGDLDPSKTKIIINQTIKMLTDWTKNHVDPKAHDQLVGVGVITHGEHKITSSQGGKYFDFSECEDVTKMAEHKKIMEEGLINDFKKIAAGDREKEYEILKDGFYRNTGSDVIKKLPVLKYRKDSLRITKI